MFHLNLFCKSSDQQFMQRLRGLSVSLAGIWMSLTSPCAWVYNPDGRLSHLVQQLTVPMSVPAYFRQTILGHHLPCPPYLHSLAWPAKHCISQHRAHDTGLALCHDIQCLAIHRAGRFINSFTRWQDITNQSTTTKHSN